MAFHSKKLKNDVVTEFIKGLCETYPGLQYLDGFPDVKVVLRADLSGVKHDKVAVISGGGSGHEPAHAGFVGVGMLTAAICGDVLASPSVDSILAGIRAVTGPSGCLLIVKNYTRDCLNFRLAAEQAKSEGYKVEMVIVGDDCALPPPGGIAERRGLAGTILVQKIAGAAAASGLSLEEVAAEAKQASDRIGTMGVALSVCTLLGQVTPDRLGSGKMELGLGIDGEPGAAVADLQPVDIVVSHVLKRILSTETNYVPITRGSRVVLMINGLGATTYMELMIAAGKAVPELQLEHGLAVERVYTGSFMTSLDTAGFSITVMKADQAILNRLDAPTRAPNWPVAGDGNHPSTKIPVPVPPSRSKTSIETFSRPEQLSPLGHILEEAVVKIPMTVVVLGDSDAGKSTLSGQIIKLTNQKTTPAAQYENLIQTEYDYKRWFGKYNAELKWKPYILAGLRDRKMARELDYLDTEILDYHTQEVGRAYFETEEKKITILDPPGLKIRRSNLISAISEADMGLLVISAPYNEISDQIREQILLARAFQITNLLVVLNKQDHSSL